MSAGEAGQRADRGRSTGFLGSPPFEPATDSDNMASGPEPKGGWTTGVCERAQVALALIDIEHFRLEIDGHYVSPGMTATEKLTSSCGTTSTTRPGYSRDASVALV